MLSDNSKKRLILDERLGNSAAKLKTAAKQEPLMVPCTPPRPALKFWLEKGKDEAPQTNDLLLRAGLPCHYDGEEMCQLQLVQPCVTGSEFWLPET